jgi:2-keto-3-deoxy-L-rhamnonate aldolase RhmA
MITTFPNSNLQLGSWLQTGSPVVAELADASGFDWLLIDLEHGCGTEAMVLPQIQVIRHAAPIVRVGAPHPDLIARSLDWGAAGIMVPMVSSAEKAEACVRAMQYPPRGDRGLAGMVRAFQYGLHRNMPTPVFYAQIETIEGVENARAIAAVDGVDVLFIGPMDLKLQLQSHPERARLDFAGCLREVASAARQAGKACGLLCRQTDDFAELQTLGFTHLAIETDITLLRESYRNVLQPLRLKKA